MRLALLALSAFMLPAATMAQKAPSKPATVDPGDLTFLTDGRGHVLAAEMNKKKDALLFYRSRRGPFYRQRVFSFSNSTMSKKKFWAIWSPQARGTVDARAWGSGWHGRNGSLNFDKTTNEWLLICARRKTKLVPVDEKRSQKLRKAKFLEPKHRREAYLLARDDSGTYFYVDSLRLKFGGGDFRFFVGKPGAMKRQQLTSIIRDEIGDVFISRAGRFVRNKRKKSVEWIPSRGKTEEVFILELNKNDFLVYGGLGVYKESLGTPCDDM